MDRWFPQTDGARVCAGTAQVWVRDETGRERTWTGVHRPSFRAPGSRYVIANGHDGRPPGLYQIDLVTGDVAPLTVPDGDPQGTPAWGANALSVGAGVWAAARAEHRAIQVSTGAIVDDAASPSVWGHSLLCVKHPWDARIHLALNPPARGETDRPYLRLADGDIRTPRLVEDLIAWCIGTVVWFRWPDGRMAPVGLGRDEFWPVPVRVDGVIYLMTHDHYGHLMLRMPGMTLGRVIHRGVTDYPAIAATGRDDEVHVAWSAGGALGEWRGRLRDLPLVDLTDLRKLDPARRFPPRTLVDVGEAIDVVGVFAGREPWTRGPETDGPGTLHLMQGRQWGTDAAGYAAVSKGHDPYQREIIVFGPEGLGWAFDRTNELADPTNPAIGYRIVAPGSTDTAALYPLRMRAGDERRTPVEVLRTKDGHRARYLFIGRCLRVARDEHGDLHGVFSWEFDGDGGWREEFSGHAELGRWQWRAIRKRTGEVTDVWTGPVERDPVPVASVPVPYQAPPVRVQEVPVLKPPSVGRADYPRQIPEPGKAGFDMLVEDPENGVRLEWAVRHGERSTFRWTVGERTATRQVAHPTSIAALEAPTTTPPAGGAPTYRAWVLEQPTEFTRLRVAIDAKWPALQFAQAVRDEKLAHAIIRRFEGKPLAQILQEIANEGNAPPPPVEPPPVKPPPAPPVSPRDWPSRDQVRRVRGLFSLGPGEFSYWSAVYSDAQFDDLCRRSEARGDTHVLIGLHSHGYGGNPPFDVRKAKRPGSWRVWPGDDDEGLRSRASRFLSGESKAEIAARRAAQLLARGFVPTFVLHDDDAATAPQHERADRYEFMWRRAAPFIRPVAPFVLPAFEWNDHLTPKQQDRLLRVLAELFPDAYRLVTFTDDRWALWYDLGHPEAQYKDDPVWGLPGGKAEYQWWQTMNGIVHGLAYQAPWDQINDHRALRERLATISIRLTGARQPEFPDVDRDAMNKFGGVPAGAFDVVYWEGPAEWVISGRRDVAWADRAGAAALTVPGVIGAGDGWRG